jgi:hypothetical protein
VPLLPEYKTAISALLLVDAFKSVPTLTSAKLGDVANSMLLAISDFDKSWMVCLNTMLSSNLVIL